MRQLESDNGWKSDVSIKPTIIDHKWMTSIREATDKVLAALPQQDQKRLEIQSKFAALGAKDRENREIRKQRTRMSEALAFTQYHLKNTHWPPINGWPFTSPDTLVQKPRSVGGFFAVDGRALLSVLPLLVLSSPMDF